MSRAALVLQHHPHIGIGAIGEVLAEHGFVVAALDAVAADWSSMPDALDPGLVVILGGEMGVYETQLHAFLAHEIQFVRDRMAARRPTLGVCLGAQLMAAAGGGRAMKGPHSDLGYRPVRLSEAGRTSPLRHFAGIEVLEWHGDTFDLPDGARLLASSDAYRHEAYAIGDWALAVQFHPETTDAMHEQWVQDCRAQISGLGLDADAMRADQRDHGAAMTRAMRLAIGEWLDALPQSSDARSDER